MSATTAGVGFSSDMDPDLAADEALKSALSNGAEPPILAIVYATISYDQEALLKAIRKRLPDATTMVGASSQGVSINGKATEPARCMAVAVLRSSKVTVKAAYVEGLAADPAGAGRSIIEQLGPLPEGPSGTFVFYDPLTGANVAALLGSLANAGYLEVFGGASGQPWGALVRTFQYFGDRALTDSVIALSIRGLRVVHEMTHGADPIGLELTVTRTNENIVEEIDGRPALDVWCEQLGVEPSPDIENTANWALGIKPPNQAPYEGLFTRAPFGLDPVKRTITLQAPIAAGSRVQVCVRTLEGVRDRARVMAQRMKSALVGKDPVIALSFECAARPSPFLGPKGANDEVVEIQKAIGEGIPWLGMYAWGEIAPVAGRAEFHNFTFPLCVLCE